LSFLGDEPIVQCCARMMAPSGYGAPLPGLSASLASIQVVRSLLYETSAADPLSIGTTLGLLFVTAAFIPAYRASRVDPMKALRQE
jgi:ABC-type lipoprotein release transport system permease subunit